MEVNVEEEIKKKQEELKVLADSFNQIIQAKQNVEHEIIAKNDTLRYLQNLNGKKPKDEK